MNFKVRGSRFGNYNSNISYMRRENVVPSKKSEDTVNHENIEVFSTLTQKTGKQFSPSKL